MLQKLQLRFIRTSGIIRFFGVRAIFKRESDRYLSTSVQLQKPSYIYTLSSADWTVSTCEGPDTWHFIQPQFPSRSPSRLWRLRKPFFLSQASYMCKRTHVCIERRIEAVSNTCYTHTLLFLLPAMSIPSFIYLSNSFFASQSLLHCVRERPVSQFVCPSGEPESASMRATTYICVHNKREAQPAVKKGEEGK